MASRLVIELDAMADRLAELELELRAKRDRASDGDRTHYRAAGIKLEASRRSIAEAIAQLGLLN